jgi:hypothetical protein
MSRRRQVIALLLVMLPLAAAACTDPSGPSPAPNFEQQGSETK